MCQLCDLNYSSQLDVTPMVIENSLSVKHESIDDRQQQSDIVSQNSIKIDDMHMIDLNEDNEAINMIGDTATIENTSDDVIEIQQYDNTFKKPMEASKMSSNDSAMRNGGKMTRELVSCIMTTSGFISPAREGKLPEAKRPIIILEEEEPSPPPPVVPKRESKTHDERKHSRNEDSNRADVKTEHSQGVSTASGNETNVKEKLNKNTTLPLSIQQLFDMDFVVLKKKLKHGQLEPGTMKELKKAKKMGQLASLGAKHRKLLKLINKILSKPTKKRLEKMGMAADALPPALNPPDILNPIVPDKTVIISEKKKMKSEQAMKRKKLKELQKQESTAEFDQKPRKKMKIGKHGHVDLTGISIPEQNSLVDRFGMHPPDLMVHTMKPTIDVENYGAPQPPRKSMDSNQTDKLSNEPDKRKLNIFKKISSSNNNTNQFDQQIRKQKLNIPQFPPPPDPMQMLSGGIDMRQLPSFSDLGLPGMMPMPGMDMNVKKKIKPPKPPKERKLNKDGSPRKQRTPKEHKLLQPQIDMAPNPKMSLQMFPNMGLFDQYSGPGLIPNNPLIPPASFGMPGPNLMGSNPFNVLPNFDMTSFRFKRPHFNEMLTNESHVNVNEDRFNPTNKETMSSQLIKASCHVAPLVPPSLLSPDKQTASTSHIDLSMSNRQFYQHKRHTEITSHTMVSSTGTVPDSSLRTTYDSQLDQKTTIIIDSDDDDNENQFTSNKSTGNAPAIEQPSTSEPIQIDQSDEQMHDIKREKKKMKDKSMSGHPKKEKRDKDGNIVKMKKKKKDKNKNKEHPELYKDKAALKEEKRRKKREKDRLAMEASGEKIPSEFGKHDIIKEVIRPGDGFEHREFTSDTQNSELSTIPKLTLKLAPSSSSPSPRPSTPDIHSQKKR